MQNMNFVQFQKDQYWQIPQTISGLQSTVSLQCKQINDMEGRIAQLEAIVFSNFYAVQQNAVAHCQQAVMPKYQAPVQAEYSPEDYERHSRNTYELENTSMTPEKLTSEGNSGSQTEIVEKQIKPEITCLPRENKTISIEDRSRAVALDLRASVCKLLWVHYDKLENCERVPEKLKEMYRKDWSKLQGIDVDKLIETQVKFLRVLRTTVWDEKRGEITNILKEEGYIAEGQEDPTGIYDHVTKYLRDQGYREKPQRSKKRGVQTGIGLIEIWRDYGRALADQTGESLRCVAPEEAQQFLPIRPKKTLWDKLQSQKEKICLIFQSSEENLCNFTTKIPLHIRRFYSDDPSVQRQRSQQELQEIMDGQSKLLKAHQDVLTLMNQRETIKRLMRLDELSGRNKNFPSELQKLYNDKTLIVFLTKEKRRHIKGLQQDFITKYRADVIAPVKRALTNLLRQRGYEPAHKSEVLNTSQIRYYFRSVDYAKWKLIREDSLKEIYSELKAYLDTVDEMKRAESCPSGKPQFPMSLGRHDRKAEAERAELIEAMQTPLETIDEQQQQEVEATPSLSARISGKEELQRKTSTCSQASGRSRMGWASEMSYYDEHSVSAFDAIPVKEMKDLGGQEPKKDQQKPFYALASV